MIGLQFHRNLKDIAFAASFLLHICNHHHIYEARYKDKEGIKSPHWGELVMIEWKLKKWPWTLNGRWLRKGKGLLTELGIKLLFCCFFQIWKWRKILKSLGLRWETSISCSGQVGDQLNILFLSTFALKVSLGLIGLETRTSRDVSHCFNNVNAC